MVQQQIATHVRRNMALAIAIATVAAAALLAPAHGNAQGNWVNRATSTCEAEGGTFTMPGGGFIFECAFPSTINVLDILDTHPQRTLVHICFHPAHGFKFGPVVSDNAVVCFQ